LATQDLTLQLEGCPGKQWDTVLHVQGGHVKISGGWAEFVIDNRLWPGDICMFELVKITRRLKMIVHLIRKWGVSSRSRDDADVAGPQQGVRDRRRSSRITGNGCASDVMCARPLCVRGGMGDKSRREGEEELM